MEFTWARESGATWSFYSFYSTRDLFRTNSIPVNNVHAATSRSRTAAANFFRSSRRRRQAFFLSRIPNGVCWRRRRQAVFVWSSCILNSVRASSTSLVRYACNNISVFWLPLELECPPSSWHLRLGHVDMIFLFLFCDQNERSPGKARWARKKASRRVATCLLCLACDSYVQIIWFRALCWSSSYCLAS